MGRSPQGVTEGTRKASVPSLSFRRSLRLILSSNKNVYILLERHHALHAAILCLRHKIRLMRTPTRLRRYKMLFWLSALLSRSFVGAALIRRKADEPPGLRSKQSPEGRSSQVYCLETHRIFRTALVSEACWICLRQIAFVPNAGRLTLRVRAAPTALLLS